MKGARSSQSTTRLKHLDLTRFAWPPEAVRAITAPTLIVIGDADGTRPEHAVAMFRLRGGGMFGDLAGLPAAGSPSSRARRTWGCSTAPSGCWR